MDPKVYNNILSEIFFIICGLVFVANAAKAFKDKENPKSKTTGIFWILIAIPFMVGKYIPYYLTGFIICAAAVISAIGGVVRTKSVEVTQEEARRNADKIGNWIFVPSLVLAFVAVIVAATGIVSSNNAIGVSAIVGAIVVFAITKAPLKSLVTESTRMIDTMGSVSLLPQLLGALGALFTACGVGTVVSNLVGGLIPDGSKFIATAIYCIGMALFTIIMGNAFAAFAVMTVGIGIPFLILQGANPVVVGALGMTAGFCGTLVTPMAANFNIMPAALLETKNKYSIIKAQVPMAIVLLIAHIVLMYVWAF